MPSDTDIETRRLAKGSGLADDDPLVGTTVDGRYQIVRALGAGGMGTVYEAVHLRLERSIALKVLLPSLSANDKYRRRFLREARAASAIESEHIVRASDFGTTDEGLLFFTMELLEGQDLEQFLAKHGPISWQDFESIYMQVLSALEAAHHRGVVHRDVKPANCFLCTASDGTSVVKVLDFGIAKIVGGGLGGEAAVATIENLTATNELFGTVAYMAPELVEGSPADARSDIYALGIMLFRALTGTLPFSGANAYKVLQQQVGAEVPSLRGIVPEVSAAVESVVFRAMAKKPDHRYQSVRDLEQALRAAALGVLEPSTAALSGRTMAIDRDAMPRTEPSVRQEAGSLITSNSGDVALLHSGNTTRPTFSPLLLLGFALVSAAATAVTIFAMSPSVTMEAAQPPRIGVASPSDGDAESPIPTVGLMSSTAGGSTTEESTGADIHVGAPTGSVAEEAAVVPAVEGGGNVVSGTEEGPGRHRRGGRSKKRRHGGGDQGAPMPPSLAIAAGKKCPDAVGDRFTVTGLLTERGQYFDPSVSGGTKSTRDCIENFIRTRRFGEGPPMRSKSIEVKPL